MEDGPQNIAVVAIDALGNRSEESKVVVIDNSSPEVELKAPDTVSKGGDLLFTVQVSDLSSIENFTVRFDGTVLTPGNDGSTFSLPKAELSDGENTILINVEDALGNTTEVSHTVFIDNTKPEIDLNAPLSVSRGNDLAFKVEVDDLSEISEFIVQLDGDELEPVSINGDYKVLKADLEDGEHTITVIAVDSLGNRAEERANVFVDNTKPVITLSHPDFVSLGDDLVFTAKVSDLSDLEEFTVKLGSTTLSPANDGSTFRVLANELSDGEKDIAVVAEDEYGNRSEITGELFVDNSKPTIEIDVPSSVSQGGNLEFEVGVDDLSNIDVLNVEVGGQLVEPLNNDGDYIIPASQLSDGENAIAVLAQDEYGNQASKTLAVFVDNTAPVIAVTAPAQASDEVSVAFAIEDLSALTSVQFFVDGSEAGAQTSVKNGSFVLNTASLSDGEHTVEIRTQDSLGNSATQSATIFVDNTAPVLGITSATLTNEADYVVEGSVSDATNVQVLVNGQRANVSNGKWSLAVRLTAQQTIFEIKANDAVGNISNASIKVDFDYQTPQIKWLASSGEYRGLSGVIFFEEQLVSGLNAYLNIPQDLVTIGLTAWNAQSIDQAGYMYIQPEIVDPEGAGRTPTGELFVETRYLADDEVQRGWEEWTRPNRVMPFVTEVLAPGWDQFDDEVVHKLQLRATDKAGNVSQVSTWEFKVHIIRDYVAPTISTERTVTTFSKGDGFLANCSAGQLDATNSTVTPICLDSTKVSLNGKSMNPSLSNEGYASVEIEVEDPYGDGYFTAAGDLTIEYQYVKDGDVAVDWTAAPRNDNNPKSVYLPLTKETLGDEFFVSSLDTKHVINFRAFDSEGNESIKKFDIRMDVLTEEFANPSRIEANEDIFNISFSRRSELNGANLETSYYLENSTDVPVSISVEAGGSNTLLHQWQIRRRYNNARTVKTEQWRVKYCTNCNRFGDTIRDDIDWSDWVMRDELTGSTRLNRGQVFRPEVVKGIFKEIRSETLSLPSNTQWINFIPEGLCELDDDADASFYVGDFKEYACPTVTLNDENGEYRMESMIQRRFVYSAEYSEGYPYNFLSSDSQEIEFKNSGFKVFNEANNKEIIPADGWYSIPPKTPFRIVEIVKLPSVINKDDYRVIANDDTVPYDENIAMDSDLDYTFERKLHIHRAVDAASLGTVSKSTQIINDGVAFYSVDR